MKRLSGDQKGESAPSVPGKACALNESSGRTQSDPRPSKTAVKVSRLPSGESARPLPKSATPPVPKDVLSGGESWNRTAVVCGGFSLKCTAARAASPTASAAAAAASQGDLL